MTTQKTTTPSMATHPDIIELRSRYEWGNESLTTWLVEGLMFGTGLYAAISPWVIGFTEAAPRLAMTNLVVGLAVLLLAYGFGAAYERTHGIAWVTPFLGAWLVVAPWAITDSGYTTAAWISNVVVGAAVVLLGLWMTGMAIARRRG